MDREERGEKQKKTVREKKHLQISAPVNCGCRQAPQLDLQATIKPEEKKGKMVKEIIKKEGKARSRLYKRVYMKEKTGVNCTGELFHILWLR